MTAHQQGSTMNHITLTREPYGHKPALISPDIRVTGSQSRTGAHSTHLCYIPENILEHGFAALRGELDHHVLFAVQHCTIIDNHGGSGAERERMTVELAVGEPFTLEPVGGIWMLADRDRRRLEGDGYKPVPYVASVWQPRGLLGGQG